MKFMIFNVTVMAALGYLVLNNGTPAQSVAVQDIVPSLQAAITEAAQAVSEVEAMPPLDAEEEVAVVPVSQVPDPDLDANLTPDWREDITLEAEASPAPQHMSKSDRRRALARLAESMENMSFSMLPR